MEILVSTPMEIIIFAGNKKRAVAGSRSTTNQQVGLSAQGDACDGEEGRDGGCKKPGAWPGSGVAGIF